LSWTPESTVPIEGMRRVMLVVAERRADCEGSLIIFHRYVEEPLWEAFPFIHLLATDSYVLEVIFDKIGKLERNVIRIFQPSFTHRNQRRDTTWSSIFRMWKIRRPRW
jgi:hypothetical protein